MYNISEPYTTVMYLLKPIMKKSKGTMQKTFQKCENATIINCLFKTFGGTVKTSGSENDINGIISVVDTAIVETWFNPDITSECRLALDDNNQYEILGSPENISMRNKTVKIKLKKIAGGA